MKPIGSVHVDRTVLCLELLASRKPEFRGPVN